MTGGQDADRYRLQLQGAPRRGRPFRLSTSTDRPPPTPKYTYLYNYLTTSHRTLFSPNLALHRSRRPPGCATRRLVVPTPLHRAHRFATLLPTRANPRPWSSLSRQLPAQRPNDPTTYCYISPRWACISCSESAVRVHPPVRAIRESGLSSTGCSSAAPNNDMAAANLNFVTYNQDFSCLAVGESTVNRSSCWSSLLTVSRCSA